MPVASVAVAPVPAPTKSVGHEEQHRGCPAGRGPAQGSKGSELHGNGTCSPCVWVWKAGGCHRAEECSFCHLCPEGEVKARKKAKVASMQPFRRTSGRSLAVAGQVPRAKDEASELELAAGGGQSGAALACEPYALPSPAPSPLVLHELLPPPLLSTETPRTTERVEVGPVDSQSHAPRSLPATADWSSNMHAKGACRPCGWFWKPVGCKNGEACQHCHLCPDGALRARKKAKAAQGRLDRLDEQPEGSCPGGQSDSTGGRAVELITMIDSDTSETSSSAPFSRADAGGTGVNATMPSPGAACRGPPGTFAAAHIRGPLRLVLRVGAAMPEEGEAEIEAVSELLMDRRARPRPLQLIVESQGTKGPAGAIAPP